MALNAPAVLESSARRLFPNQNLEHVLAELLLERAQKNLIKYQTMTRQFREKYGQEFVAFRQEILKSEPDYETEQDYFDWEMAVTGIDDMVEDIARLRELLGQS